MPKPTSIQKHFPRVWLVKMLDQANAGTFATAARAHQGHNLPWLHREREILNRPIEE